MPPHTTTFAEANERRMRRILYAADINLAQQAIEVSNFGRARALLDEHPMLMRKTFETGNGATFGSNVSRIPING